MEMTIEQRPVPEPAVRNPEQAVRDPVGDAYRERADELRAYVALRFGGHVAAEDVVHDCFVRLAREAMAGRLPVQVRPWLYQVAHNIAVSELRRPDRRQPEVEAADHAQRGSMPSAETEWEDAELSWELREALGSLPLAGRTTILMASGGYNGREIARAVGRSELATRALLCRTRRTLRQALAALDPAAPRAAVCDGFAAGSTAS